MIEQALEAPVPDITESPVLEASDVTFAYPAGPVALRNLSIAVPRGRRVAILGLNGSGKSTLLLHFIGILRPDRGAIRLDGEPIGYRRAQLAALRRRVGLVFQDPDSQLFAASVRQDISFGPLNLGWSEAVVRQRVEEAIDQAHIGPLADRPTHMLSGGEKKRVAIAGILAMQPEVILADEPTAGLDLESTARLMTLLNELHALGRTILISTHDVEFALGWADWLYVLHAGQLVAAGEPTRVLVSQDELERAHLVQPVVLQAFSLLRARGMIDRDAPPPRTVHELVSLVSERGACR
ncbi:MAG: ABC transporter ATP-binding protein [Chloroflexi bacterium]|nr:ABC transporter ATP-binding protein [Chloroflexota bacterium]